MSKLNDHDLSEKFMQMLFVVHYHFFRQTAFPIPASHFGTLLVLSDLGPATISDISTCLHMSKQQMTPIINKLVRSGLVSRSTPPADRRCTLLELTAQGQAILGNHSEKIRLRFIQGLEKLPPEDTHIFGVAIDNFTSAVQKMFPLPNLETEKHPTNK